MTLQLKTKPTLADAIMKLMADGRARTINDIRLRIKRSEDETRLCLTHLIKRGWLTSSKVQLGTQSITVYNKPRAEAAE